MAKSPEKWGMARAMFEGGASLLKIERKTGIGKSTISKKSKSERWEKGINETLIKNEVKAIVEKSTLNETALNYHNSEVEALTKHTIRTNNIAEKAQTLMDRRMRIEKDSMPVNDIKTIIEANDKASVTLGVNQRFSTQPAVINNNTNAQQNNSPEKIEYHVID